MLQLVLLNGMPEELEMLPNHDVNNRNYLTYRNTASAIGERQIFPRHTKRTDIVGSLLPMSSKSTTASLVAI